MSINILQIGKNSSLFNGGIEKVQLQIIKDFSNRNIRIDTIVNSANNNIENLFNQNQFGFKTRKILKKIDLNFKLLYYLLRRHNNYEIIWIHYPNIFPVILLCLLNKTKGQRLILHWHNDIQVFPLLYKFFQPIEKKIIQKSSLIIQTSQNYYKSSNSLNYVDKRKLITIPLKLSDKDVKLGNKKYSNKKTKLLAVGRDSSYKGFRELITIIKDKKEIELTIISGDELKKYVENLGVNNIKVLSNLNENQLNREYTQNDIFILSSISRREGFGIVILEALRSGTPILANYIPNTGSSDVVKPGVNGEFFDIKFAPSIIAGIEKIKKNKETFISYCLNARKDFEMNYVDHGNTYSPIIYDDFDYGL